MGTDTVDAPNDVGAATGAPNENASEDGAGTLPNEKSGVDVDATAPDVPVNLEELVVDCFKVLDEPNGAGVEEFDDGVGVGAPKVKPGTVVEAAFSTSVLLNYLFAVTPNLNVPLGLVSFNVI